MDTLHHHSREAGPVGSCSEDPSPADPTRARPSDKDASVNPVAGDPQGCVPPAGLRKDRALVGLAERGGNVAQFVSFVPTGEGVLRLAHSRVAGLAPDHLFPDVATALRTLLARSPARSINLRSYTPDDPRSRTFLYGLTDADAALAAAEGLARDGLWVIANETIDINDGGVSGVVLGDVIEFAPDDTPRCVEKPGVASLPLSWGRSILQTVYGFAPALDVGPGRVEFSIHPGRCGCRQAHTLVWEYEDDATASAAPALHWPNRFSRLIGDKAFGLLIAHEVGLSVPWTTVIGRRVPPCATASLPDALVPGEAEDWVELDARTPLPELRARLASLKPGTGLRLIGVVNATSHVADLLRKSGVPTRIVDRVPT